MYIVPLLLLILLAQLPALLAKRIMEEHSKPREDLPGNGRELLQHLKKKFKLNDLKIDETPLGDHFNPITNTVCLTKQNLEAKSLTAVAVASHEFSHALQYAEGSSLLKARTYLAKMAEFIQKFFNFALIFGLIVSFIQPQIALLIFAVWFLSVIFGVIIHFVTLPVELDASYRKALPILEEGNYLEARDMKAVRKILGACAYTYLAASLASFIVLFYIIFRRGRFL